MANLEDKIDARQIVMEAGMSTRPEFYSGRGAISCDLNDKHLEKIYQIIKKEYGNDTAKQYAQMVADIPKLSATDFLITLYRLEGNEWEWDKRILGNERGAYVDGETDEAKMAVGMATIFGALTGDSERDETDYIRGEFLERHRDEIMVPKRKKRYSKYGGYNY